MPTKTKETIVTFGAVKRANLWFPMRYRLEDGKVISEEQAGPAGPYRQLAFQYAEAAMADYQLSLSMKETHDAVADTKK